MMSTQIGKFVTLNCGFEEAVEKTTAALKQEGFGVLTEIDVQATMKKKLELAIPAYKILGACNPPLAHRALESNSQTGLLLPCNVTVRTREDGQVEVGLLDPIIMSTLLPGDALSAVAEEAQARLDRVHAALSQ